LPLAVVGSYRLSDRAKAELVTIYDDSEARFGSYQADAYLAGLDRIFGLLADFPGIGQGADYLKAGFRRFRFQAHIVLYTEDRDGVLIRSVLHGARDIRPELFE
jgi:toxin ParE1/3/4